MRKQQTPLKKRLQVRATLLTALIDAQGAAFDSIYTYWVPRPSQVDRSIFPAVEEPSNPSYPSLLSTTSRTAAVILGHFFPEGNPRWDNLAEEAGLSRLSAGTHFMMDHQAGKTLGEKIGNRAVRPGL